MINIKIDTTKIDAYLPNISQSVLKSLVSYLNLSSKQFQEYVRKRKLDAAPGYSRDQLHVVTHKLTDSIRQNVTADDKSVKATIWSANKLPYAPIHEFGGTIYRHGSHVGTYAIRIPERSYMRSSLAENRDNIVAGITRAVKDGLKR